MLETLVAAAVMLIGICGVMSLFTVAALKNASQGTQASRCTEYAQDKMEQLMALQNFFDTWSDTTVVPTNTATTAGGTGLATGGSIYPNAPAVGYKDYITEGSGTGAAIYATKQPNSAYVRQWNIAPTSDANVKTITVTVASLLVSGSGATPSTTLVAQKTNFQQP